MFRFYAAHWRSYPPVLDSMYQHPTIPCMGAVTNIHMALLLVDALALAGPAGIWCRGSAHLGPAN
jgi:hypothetical protein